MLACIPTEANNGQKTKVSSHFGMAPFFTFYDSETRILESFPNRDRHKGQGACNLHGKIGPHEIDCIICPSMGKNALAQFKKLKIPVYETKKKTVEEVIAQIHNHQLNELQPHQTCAEAHGDDLLPHHNGQSCRHNGCADGTCNDGFCPSTKRFDV